MLSECSVCSIVQQQIVLNAARKLVIHTVAITLAYGCLLLTTFTPTVCSKSQPS